LRNADEARRAAFFFRSPEVRFHAANLASLFLLQGLLRATSHGIELSRRFAQMRRVDMRSGAVRRRSTAHSLLAKRGSASLTCAPGDVHGG
jgi:hypothetical protein